MMEEKIKLILKLINSYHHEAYVVGGFVRDYLLGKETYDIDITTSASKEELLNILSPYHPYVINKHFDTVTVNLDEYQIEITPYRIDGYYLNHRHPSSIQRTSSLMDDLSRRDFTINAILMDVNENIIDPLNGYADLKDRIIRAIGDPLKRFEEDALRILRAIRFKARLGFEIEDQTKKAIYLKKELLKDISMFRKQTEIIKTVRYDKRVIDEYRDIFDDIIRLDVSINLMCDNETLLWALMLNRNKEDIDKLLISKKELNNIRKLFKYTDSNDYVEAFSEFDDPQLFIDYMYHLKGIDLKELYISSKDYIVNRNNLDISAHDLMALGYHDVEIGRIQKRLIEDIRKCRLKNKKEDIIAYLHML